MRLSDPHTPASLRQLGNQIVVDFAGAEVASNLARRYDAGDFATPVTGFDVVRVGDGVRLAISATGDFEHLAYQSDDQYVVEVQPARKAAAEDRRQARLHGRAPHAELPGHRNSRRAAAPG